MPLAISPITPAVSAQAADLGAILQPGTVVNAAVLDVLDANLVRIAIASLTLDAATTTPLQRGQTLQLAVSQSASGLTLTPVAVDTGLVTRDPAVIVDDIPLAPNAPSAGDAAQAALSPDETRAVASASQAAVAKQAGLSPLFANLSTAVTSGTLPQPVLLAAAQLLALRQPRDQAFTAADIKAALASSGLVLEAQLAATPSAAFPDIKAALTVLRQTLATWLGAPAADQSPAGQLSLASAGSDGQAGSTSANSQTTSPSFATGRAMLGGTMSATAARIASATARLIDIPADSENPLGPATPGTTRAGAAEAQPVRPSGPPPPFRGALPAAQTVATPTLAPDAPPIVIARQLLADTDGALARQTLLQVASLPDRNDLSTARSDPMQPRWNFEIPFVTPQGTAMAQFEIARDGGQGTEAAERIWRARFSLDIEPAGPVHALIAFSGGTTSVKMWAERPATAAQMRANAAQLGQSLDRAELKAGDIVIADGKPAAPALSAGHFLNRAS